MQDSGEGRCSALKMPFSMAQPSIPGSSVRVTTAELWAIHFEVRRPFTHRQFSHADALALICNRASDFLRSANLPLHNGKIGNVDDEGSSFRFANEISFGSRRPFYELVRTRMNPLILYRVRSVKYFGTPIASIGGRIGMELLRLTVLQGLVIRV